MKINQQTTLFFDASVLVAAAHSPSGGSALLLAACRAGGFVAQTTGAVLLESRNVLEDFPRESRRRFYQSLVEIKWELLPMPPAGVLEQYGRYINAKDVHVLAAAVEGRSQFLLTLDRRHILAAAEAVKRAGLPITILRPGDFIQEYYPQHEDFPLLPTARS
jgi:predicted nucleic acid-binding protein